MAAIIKVILKGKLEKNPDTHYLASARLRGQWQEGWICGICAPGVGKQGCPDGPRVPALTRQPWDPLI